jgi:hypothetical protein
LILTLSITSPDIPPPLRATEATSVLPGRPINRYLFALLVGGAAGILSALLSKVWISSPATALVPPLVISMLVGFITGKRVVARKAGLFAGLVVGASWVSGFIILVSRTYLSGAAIVGNLIVLLIAMAVCGLLSWLVAWLTTRKHPYYLSSGSRNQKR